MITQLLIPIVINFFILLWLGYQDFKYMTVSNLEFNLSIIIMIGLWLYDLTLSFQFALLSLALTCIIMIILYRILKETFQIVDIVLIFLLLLSTFYVAVITLLVYFFYSIVKYRIFQIKELYPALTRLFFSYILGVLIFAILVR
jgi:hypothetical protein